MKRVLSLVLALLVLASVSLAFPMVANAKDYAKISDIYMAEKFLADDSAPAGANNRSPWIGTSCEVLIQGQQDIAYLDKTDKKQGNSSLAQKVMSGGKTVDYWLAGPEKFDIPSGAQGIDISKCANPGISFWFFINDPKAIGGDRSIKDENFGSFIFDFGEDAGGGVNNQKNTAFWICADELVKGWNQIVVPCKPAAVDSSTNAFVFAGKTFGYRKTEQALNYKALDWFRIHIISKSALLVKLDDMKFVDLGSDQSTAYKQSSTSTKPSSTAPQSSTVQSNDTPSTESIQSTESTVVPGDTSSEASSLESTDSQASSSVASKKDDTVDTDAKGSLNIFLIIGLIVLVLALFAGFAGIMIFVVVPKMVKSNMSNAQKNTNDDKQ